MSMLLLICRFLKEMALFSFKSYLYRIVQLTFEISALKLTMVKAVDSVIVITSSTFLMLSRDFVVEYHHAKFGCDWTTNKGETEGQHPAFILPI